MSYIQWTQEQTLLFLETLQSEPVIWDPNERGHKDKKKVNDAWLRIQEILKIPTAELKKKKESLIATYRGYNRKKEASIKSGAGVEDVYRPVWFAYEYMDSFLGSVFKCKKTINTVSFLLINMFLHNYVHNTKDNTFVHLRHHM